MESVILIVSFDNNFREMTSILLKSQKKAAKQSPLHQFLYKGFPLHTRTQQG